MKRKILLWIKQKLCRHQYEFVECDSTRILGYFPSWYFLYRCEKCRKNKIVYIGNVIRDLHDVDPIQSIDYPKETLWLPNTLAYELLAHKWESREAGYLVSKYYNKYGILLTAWGNLEFGPKIDRDNLEMKSHDEILDGIKRGDGLGAFILSPNELRENSGLTHWSRDGTRTAGMAD